MNQINPGRDRTLIDIREDILRAGAWIVSGIVLATLVAVTFIFLATPYYRVQLIVAPANPMNGAGFAVMSGPDGFPVLRENGEGNNNSNDFLRFENMLAGPSVAAKLLQDEKIQRGLLLDKSFGFSAETTDWTPELLAEYIGQRVRLEPVGASVLRRAVYMHPSREFGVYFLHRLHRVTDEMIRVAVRGEANSRVRYLEDASFKVRNPDHRRSLTVLLMEQERLLMLASIDQPYAASIVEPPAGSSKPRWPDALMIVPVLMFAGALLGFVLHGLFSPRCRHYPVSMTIRRKAWYAPDNVNTDERRLTERNRDRAAE